jgi:hypothetical protein
MLSCSAVMLDDIEDLIRTHPESVAVDRAPELARWNAVSYARIVSRFE